LSGSAENDVVCQRSLLPAESGSNFASSVARTDANF
jgi:hypothetical protein